MGYLVLHKIVREQNQARYYALTWQPALIGGWAVERTWGRLSSPSRRQRTMVVEDLDTALAVVCRHARRRLQHNYHLVEGDIGDLFEQRVAR